MSLPSSRLTLVPFREANEKIALEQWREWWHLQSPRGWVQSQHFNQSVKSLSSLNSFRVTNHEWHSLRLFEHPALVLIVVFSKHETLIGGVYNNGIFKLARGLEVLKKAADIVINAFYATKEFSEIRVVGKLLVFIVRVVVWIEVSGEFFRVPCWKVAEVGPPRVSSTN